MLIDDITKYIKNPSNTRLTIILESYGKVANKKNIDSIKMLIEDYQADNKLEPVLQWLDPKAIETAPVAVKDLPKINLDDQRKLPMNQDHFEHIAVKIFGDPKDPESFGNKILSGRVHNKFNVQSYYHPDTLLDKFALLANKPSQPLEFFPRGAGAGATEPVWEVCIVGSNKIDRMVKHF